MVEEIKRLGKVDPKDGKVKVPFGIFVRDDRCNDLCMCFYNGKGQSGGKLTLICYMVVEAMAGTLKAAKKRKIITYEGELLLQGAHDKVDIVLL